MGEHARGLRACQVSSRGCSIDLGGPRSVVAAGTAITQHWRASQQWHQAQKRPQVSPRGTCGL